MVRKTPEKHNKEAKDWSKKTEKHWVYASMLQKPRGTVFWKKQQIDVCIVYVPLTKIWLSMGISDEIKVATIAIDETTMVQKLKRR